MAPIASALAEKAAAIRQAELARAANKLTNLTGRDLGLIDSMTAAIVDALLERPLVQLRECAGQPDEHCQAELIRELFKLQPTP